MVLDGNSADDKSRWDRLVVSSPGGSFLQSWAWGELQRELGVPFWRITHADGCALVVRRPLPLGLSWHYVPRGPLATADAADRSALTAELVALAKRERTLFVRAEPYDALPEPWHQVPHAVAPQHTLVLALTRSEEELLAAMHTKVRYNIRLARRRGVVVRFSHAERDLESFLRLAGHVEQRGTFHYHPAAYYRAQLRVLGAAGMMEVAIAEHNGAAVAAHLLVSFDGTVTYLHGASSSQHRSLMAPHLLQWESIRRAQMRGFVRYDFWGVAPPDAPADHPWAGITRFKEGFGGDRESYPGAYDCVVRPPGYLLYTAGRRLKRFLR